MNDESIELFTLWALRENGLVEKLCDNAWTPAELAVETDMSERAAAILTAALTDWGYLERERDAYQSTADFERLESDDIETMGVLPHRLDSLERYLELPATIQGQDPPKGDAESARTLAAAMATIDESVVRASVTAAEHVHPRPERVLDVGGGPGNFAVEFARRGATVTLVDLPAVVEAVAPTIDVPDVECVAGNVLEGLPDGQDLAFCSRLTHVFSPEDNRRLFREIYSSLEPGGTVVCTDFVRGRSERAATFAVHMLAQTSGGNTYDEETYMRLLDDSGFVDTEIRNIPGTEFQAIVGHRP